MSQAKRSYKAQHRTFPQPGSPDYEALKNQALQFLVQRAEFAQKADEMGIKISDKKVDDRLNQIKKQYFGGNQKRYLQQLKQQGLTETQVRADIKSQLVSEELFKKVTTDVKVSDKDIEKYYKAHKSQYGQPESRDVRHILVSSKTQADSLYAQIKGGADFAALAKKFSKDPGSKKLGGKLTVSKGQTVPPFDKVAFSLKKGEISQPVKTQYGYHIIQALSDVHPAKTTPLSQVKESIRQQLLQTKKNEAMTNWVNGVKKDFKSKIKYQVGYKPPPAPTVSSATSTSSK
jgi:parvulin-like peptidyl-prolyl isomerase